ncbi:hypothetical protein HMPREF9176_1326 [Streptococcus downei F0415]|nr:hypothetical protein HMPREF9176_1326 [Streptococcus downei F0415]
MVKIFKRMVGLANDYLSIMSTHKKPLGKPSSFYQDSTRPLFFKVVE